jgi:hypothetical protein
MLFAIMSFFLTSFFVKLGEGVVASKFGVEQIGYWESCLIVLAIFGAAIVFRTGFSLIDVLKDILNKIDSENK